MTNLEYICFLNETGYGQAASDLIFALLETNRYNIKINCINGKPTISYFDKSYLDKIIPLLGKNNFANSIQVYHCIPNMQFRFPRNQRAVGFATFETFDPPDSWIKLLNGMDAVVCPSMFNFKIFAHAGLQKPIFYIPHTIDGRLYNQDVPRLVERNKFTFLFFGSWKKRKGWHLLLESYLNSFTESDNVQLLIKTDKINMAIADIDRFKERFRNKKDLPPILLERRLYNNAQLPAFLKSVHCLVMPTLGEGFGLPALQCMALKVPVIITNFSGCQDYANEKTCRLIEPVGFVMERDMDHISQFSNKKWPHLTLESISAALLEVFANYQTALDRASYAYEFVQNKFSYNVASKAFVDMMETVYHD